MIKTIHHRDTETQRMAKAREAFVVRSGVLSRYRMGAPANIGSGFSLCLGVSVVGGFQ